MLKNKNLKMLLLVLFLVAVVFVIYRATKREGMELKPSEFMSELDDGKKLVLIYADWCGHCKKIKPTWDTVSEKVNKENEVKMVKINCGEGTPEQKKLMSKYNVDGYPTILIVDKGNATVYDGERTEDALLKQASKI
jgi:protein disulfide-isomerase A1